MGVQISTDIDPIRNLQRVILIELFCNHSSVISERLFSGYIVTETKDHQLILEPLAKIPAREKWLFDNKVALRQVDLGLKDAKNGRVSHHDSFAQQKKR